MTEVAKTEGVFGTQTASKHKGTGMLASFFWKRLILVSIPLLRRFRPRQGAIIFLTRGICVKYGPLVTLSEARNLEFLAANPSVPVPKLYCAFEHRGVKYIVMSRIHGTAIGRGWDLRSGESKDRLLSQLKRYISQMRELAPPHYGYVGGVQGGPIFDHHIPAAQGGFGPFDSVAEFHKAMREGLEEHPDNLPWLNELITMQRQSTTKTCFSHGDLSSLNIIVKGDDIAGIIDWETSGWYPEYWEYTQTYLNLSPYDKFWSDQVDSFLDPYSDTIKMEELRVKYIWGY